MSLILRLPAELLWVINEDVFIFCLEFFILSIALYFIVLYYFDKIHQTIKVQADDKDRRENKLVNV